MNTGTLESKKALAGSYEFHPVPSPDAWSAAVRTFVAPHVLQSWAWSAFKTRWGWSAQRLLLNTSGRPEQPIAAVSVLKRKIPRTPYSILYAPRGPILDYRNSEARRIVFDNLARLARQERALFIKVDPEVVLGRDIEPGLPDPDGMALVSELEQWGWRYSRDQVQFRNTVLLDLTRPEEELLAGMKQKTRYNIRLAGRNGVTVRPGDPSDFRGIAEMYRETAGRDGFAIRPLEYYLDAWQTLYDGLLAFPFVAEYGGRPLAAVIIVRSGNKAIYMYGASRQLERQRMPNHLLQWEAIRWAKSAGCEVYDFWGAPDDFVESDRLWGVWRFKEGFAGQVVKHIGAWDYPARPLLYWLYTALIPRYLAFLRSRRKAGAEAEAQV